MIKYQKILPVILFAILSLVIIFPLLFPGYILTLDQIMVGKIVFPSIFSESFFLSITVWALHLIMPTYLIQKIILFAIIILSGWSMQRLIGEKYGIARYFGGIFYAINPFTYARIMAGHWQLLLGYSIFPIFLLLVSDFFQNPARKTAIKLGIITTIILTLFIHLAPILAITIFLYGVIYIFYHSDKILELTKPFLIFCVTLLILNLNWIIPFLIGRATLNNTLNQFTHEDLIAFQSVPDSSFGLIFNLLSGYGFWPEVYKYYTIPKDIIFFWPIVTVLIIGISIMGFLAALREKDKLKYPLIITLTLLFLVSLDFAGGIALKSFAGTAFSLYDNFPILRGLREPQKLIGIVMFFYAYFGSIGIAYLLAKIKKSYLFYVLCSMFLILPFVYTPTVFGGFWGQLKPVFYPDSWKEVNQILNEDKDDYVTLFFPWHQYMRFNFNSNRVIANPVPIYFDKTVLTSQNYETIPLYTHDTRSEALHVDGLLRIEKEGVNLLGDTVDEKFPWGESLLPINVKYIILAKDDDWESYKFLDYQTDLKKIYGSSTMDLYQNLKWVAEE